MRGIYGNWCVRAENEMVETDEAFTVGDPELLAEDVDPRKSLRPKHFIEIIIAVREQLCEWHCQALTVGKLQA